MSISENWTRENLAWAAGLFDGEGTISIKPGTIQLSLGMTDEDVVKRFREVIGVGKVYGPYQDKRQTHYKPMWVWACSGFHHTQAVLASLWEWLGSRRRLRSAQAISSGAKRRPRGVTLSRCVNGHEYTKENTFLSTLRGQKYKACRVCRRAASKEHKRRIRGFYEHRIVQ